MANITKAFSPLPLYLCQIGSKRSSIKVSCRSSNRWNFQEDLLKKTSYLQTSYNRDGFNSTKFGLLVKDVKYALRTQINNNNNLVLVDTLQRMGIEHHFQQEIQSILQKEYEQNTCFLKYQNHHDISLCFRLLRQEGYHVSADVFKKLKNNDDGTFGLNLNQDVNGLIGLYEASQLGVEGEYILDEIAKFSGDHLNACLANSDEARIIKETLKYPYHKSLSRWKNKSFINNFKGINGWGKNTLKELANMDYFITKEIHQHELAQVFRWWKSLGLAEELKLLRDQPLKWYTWPMAMLTDPKMSQERIELAKCISFVYVIDDIFDVYGTIEELTLFTQAVHRWELSAMMDLPEYMRSLYKALYNTINSIGYNIYKIYGQNPTQNLQNTWAHLCSAFLIEAKWFACGMVPTTDEYLKNGLVSSGVYVALIHLFYILGLGVSSMHLQDISLMSTSIAKILRLWDDLGSAKDENQEGKDGSYVEYYMKENKDSSMELAREHVIKLIEDEWKQLNKEHFCLMSQSTRSFSKASLNSARMVSLMYSYDDKQSLPILQEYIKSMLDVKEAREYLSKKNEKLKTKQERTSECEPEVENISIPLLEEESIGDMNQLSDKAGKEFDRLPLCGTSDFAYEDSSFKQEEFLPTSNSAVAALNKGKCYQSLSSDDDENSRYEELKSLDLSSPEQEATVGDLSSQLGEIKIFQRSVPLETSDLTSSSNHCQENNKAFPANDISEHDDKEAPPTVIPETHSHQEDNSRTKELEPSPNNGSWLEKNFHEFEPVIKKIQMGFRDNYRVAKEKSDEELNLKTQMFHLETNENVTELEWMKDERLNEIVFKVRENELAGREPFYQMDDEDKLAFFSGLEKKVDQENKQLQNLHEWLHSNIENLDYGADGISLYDPPEKIIPRWKGPPLEGSSEFLNYFLEQRKVVAESLKSSKIIKKERQDLPLGLQESPLSSKIDSTSAISIQDAKTKTPRTIIESSDGSIKAGKKSGKEYWQHTKKWSRGFLESYNAETDPEIKSVMKDVGKDLDKWITEREIKEAADLMDNLPEKGKKLIKEKLDKVKREMELFGPQAVVSKYREYADEKEEDYLWWLDLPRVLCIELYTEEEGEMKAGFYSLEMGADLELDPKQYHVIAFEDAGDCKNLCYIIQAQMEMLGNGNAFVVARPPKDAYRDAKTNGFNVTVIKKGQLQQLNVDQSLEEVEEAITDIGSKIYHEKIMRERSLDVTTVMKGVFGTGKPTKKRRRSRKKLKKPTSK